MTGLDFKISEVAARIRELRHISGISKETMAKLTGVSSAEYAACEAGTHDLSFAFIYRCALAFKVGVTDIIEGVSPTLKSHTVTRKGEGKKIEEAHGMTYYNLASAFKERVSEPLYVECAYDPEAEQRDIELTTHTGQELDIVLKGVLKVQIGSHTEILREGDTIYYDSSTPHGMIAVEGQDAVFYAIVLKGTEIEKAEKAVVKSKYKPHQEYKRVYHNFIDTVEDENGSLVSISFKNEDKFNFAFDVVDEIARRKPEKLAMLYVSKNHEERRFTFTDFMKESARCANYFESLGIKRGDKVMLVLKRHYQFWIATLALQKIGAVSIPASFLLQEHDYEYRYEAASVSAILCTADDDIADRAEAGAKNATTLREKILVGGSKPGWRNFDEEYKAFPDEYVRKADSPCGDDDMLLYFTSGTTGNPKMALHSFKYPLGHFHTANYWHCVDPEGLHLTISDTGWAKAAWGKIYGQWLCEAALFVYDFDKFDAADILPMFEKYKITTFCAPPTMYRMLMKEDISKYDMSSVQHATTAGEALNPEVFKQIEKLTGLKIMEGFGQTETTCLIGNLYGREYKVGAMGKPVPLYDVDIVDADGNSVGVGENGEIVIRTSERVPCGLFKGYYRDEEKTAEAWHDGLYHTGDVAYKDEDGFYFYVSRIDDVIKSSGYRIGPFEIESVIMELPYVLECGVSAEPDDVRGQVVKASIVLTKDTTPSEELKKEIQNYVKEHTAPYKYPRIVVFRDELPKTTSGKIIRNQL
ncbi:MAG: cupin domain-containing protein [Ruminococcaceae bacterium]|nr:cupin domain-containing protein [Oscillospiraceae bacterium]